MGLAADSRVNHGADPLTLSTKCRRVRMRFIQFVREFHREESGQDMLEYALVLFAVLSAVIAGSTTLSSTITDALNTINGNIQGLL